MSGEGSNVIIKRCTLQVLHPESVNFSQALSTLEYLGTLEPALRIQCQVILSGVSAIISIEAAVSRAY